MNRSKHEYRIGSLAARVGKGLQSPHAIGYILSLFIYLFIFETTPRAVKKVQNPTIHPTYPLILKDRLAQLDYEFCWIR